MKKVLLCLLGIWIFVADVHGQKEDSLLLYSDPVIAELDSILNSPDSLSILDLIDSILLAPSPGLRSQVAVRAGYNNNIVANGTSGIRQYGLNAGVSYYHKSGMFVDATSYYSNEYKPSLYLTIASAGYLATVTKFYSVMAEYDHYFYTPANSEIYTPYTNNIFLSNYFKVKKFILRFDYNFYFGELTANRITPGIGYNFTKKRCLGIDRISFLPAVSLWYGSDTIVEYVPNWRRPLGYIILLRQGLPLYTEQRKTVWGIMNYTVSFPLSVQHKNWSFVASYTLNFLRSLPGEGLGDQRTGFAGVSITRYFDL